MGVARILLLMDNRGDDNWGSQATTNALVGLLVERFPGAEVRGVPRSKCRPKGQIKRWLATTLAPGLIGESPSNWALGALASSWEREVKWADLVVVNGEGTLHPQPQAIRWICATTALVRRHAKPLWVVNCSLKCRGDETEPLFRAFFIAAEHVAAREPVSFEEMRAVGIAATQAADCAFLTQPAPEDETREILDRAGVRRPFAVMTGSASIHKWPLGHQREVLQSLKDQGLDVLYTFSDRRDADNARLLGDLPTVSNHEATFAQLTTIQSQAEILVGGRFHPTILAALVGTPFVAVPSNTHKMSGLMQMLGAEQLLCDFTTLDRVVPTIMSVLQHRDEWSRRLRESATAQVDQAKLNVKT